MGARKGDLLIAGSITPQLSNQLERMNNMYTRDEMYDILRDYLLLPDESLELAIAIGGFNTETLERILFYYTGYRTFDGYMEEVDGEEYV